MFLPNLATDALLLLGSFAANVMSAFSGGGAGLLQLPLLLFLGLPFGVAMATHKIATVALCFGSALRYRREALFERPLLILMLAFGIPGVILGSLAVVRTPEKSAEAALGLLMLALSAYSLTQPHLGTNHAPTNRHRKGYILGGSALFLIGFTNGFLSAGTGLILTLWLVRWFGLDFKRAVGYAMVLGSFWNIAGALTLVITGSVAWNWLIPLLLGATAGGYLGTHIGIKKGSLWMKRGFEAITLALGLALLIRSFV